MNFARAGAASGLAFRRPSAILRGIAFTVHTSPASALGYANTRHSPLPSRPLATAGFHSSPSILRIGNQLAIAGKSEGYPALASRSGRRRWQSSEATSAKSGGSDKLHGSHHWTYERLLSIALLPTISYALIFPASALVDFVLGVVVPLHSYLGVQAVVTDYLPKRRTKVGYWTGTWLNRLLALSLLVACWRLNTSDAGISRFVRGFWHAQRKNRAEEDAAVAFVDSQPRRTAP